MKIKYLIVSTKRFFWVFSILTGLIWGYSIACHFLDFYLRPWDERGLILVGVAAIASFHAYKLAQVTLPHLKSQNYAALICNTLILTSLVYVLIPALLPVFPMFRRLDIAALAEKNTASKGSAVEITSIYSKDSPIQYLAQNGRWDQSGNTFRTAGVQPASLTYAQLMRNDPAIQIIFRTSPDSGKATVTWDGITQKLDLYSATNGHQTINLSPNFPWDKLGTIRQAFLVTTLISDFVGLSILFLAGET